jgi:hypothetical protein
MCEYDMKKKSDDKIRKIYIENNLSFCTRISTYLKIHVQLEVINLYQYL